MGYTFKVIAVLTVRSVSEIMLVLFRVLPAHQMLPQPSADRYRAVSHFRITGCCQMPPDLERVTDTLISLGKSPNLGAVLIVSLGCEGTDVERLYKEVSATGKHVEIIRIQELGGVSNAIQKGTDIARNMAIEISGLQREETDISEVVMSIKCGASDTTSGIASNCVIG